MDRLADKGQGDKGWGDKGCSPGRSPGAWRSCQEKRPGEGLGGCPATAQNPINNTISSLKPSSLIKKAATGLLAQKPPRGAGDSHHEAPSAPWAGRESLRSRLSPPCPAAPGEGTGRGTGGWPRGAAEAGRAPAPPGARGCPGGAAASPAAGTLTDLAQGGHEEPPPFRAVLLAEEFVRLRRRLHGARRRLLRIGAVRLAAPRPATAPGAWGALRGGKEKPPPPALVRAGPRWGSQPPLARLLTPPPGRPSHPAREGPGSGAARRALTGRRVRRRRPRSLRPRYRRRPPRACAAAPRRPPRPPRPAAPPGGRAGTESTHPPLPRPEPPPHTQRGCG